MKLQITAAAFWDTDMKQMDENAHFAFIITRVFQYAVIEDIKAVLKFHTQEQIQEAFHKTRGVDKRAINLAAVAIGFDPKELRYTGMPFPGYKNPDIDI